MGRIVLVVVLLLLLLLGGGVLFLGAFPPEVEMRPVEKVLPNERFQRSN
jgi:hypothetical protein